VVDREPRVVGPAAAHFTVNWHLRSGSCQNSRRWGVHRRVRGGPGPCFLEYGTTLDRRGHRPVGCVYGSVRTRARPQERDYPADSAREAIAERADEYLTI
jgi:hypothetical protein